MEQHRSPLIYESRIKDVFVLDVPTSIQQAQHSHRKLISSPPLQVPFRSLEPKSEKAKLNLRSLQVEGVAELNSLYADTISAALKEVHGEDIKNFCFDRLTDDPAEIPQRSSKKRKRGDRCIEVTQPETDTSHAGADVYAGTSVSSSDVDDFMKQLTDDAHRPNSLWGALQHAADILAPRTSDAFVISSEDTSIIVSSAAKKTATISELKFHIPPQSAALNTTLESSISNLTALHQFLSHPHGRASNPSNNQTTSPGRKFSLLLLDPPWPNSSARRSDIYRTHTYSATSDHPDSLNSLCDNLLGLGLPDVLSDDGYIAIWITNRASVRTAALELLDAWGAELVEEWVWAKVTQIGEPICELRGSGRRPWEVLLIARRRAMTESSEGRHAKRKEKELGADVKVKRRVIIAVPDLHSRKPCLKGLFERFLFNGDKDGIEVTTPVLELFARYMVAGWMSWGDEALKFQWEGCWRDE